MNVNLYLNCLFLKPLSCARYRGFYFCDAYYNYEKGPDDCLRPYPLNIVNRTYISILIGIYLDI